jgi:amino acid adenylation domain-containing protein/non-ribosomal peptide synthase protein (TIGR01720 family)
MKQQFKDSRMVSVDTALLTELKRALGDLAGQDLTDAGAEATFLDLGFDSLFLTQASALLKARFGVKVSFRQLIEEFTSLGALVRHLDQHLPADRRPQPSLAASQPVSSSVGSVPAQIAPFQAAPVAGAIPNSAGPGRGLTSTVLERIMNEQLRVMEQQLALLRGSTPTSQAFAGAFSKPTAQARTTQPSPPPGSTNTAVEPGTPFAAVTEPEPEPEPLKTQHGPFRQPDRSPKGALTDRQQGYLDRFIARYVERTPKSKAHTQRYRGAFADPRVVAGFKPEWKEMVYPIVVNRSAGAHLWDLDGNRWVDVTMGFGVGLLGHSPPFITEAIRAQLDRGVEIGPQSVVAGEVAELICELTGMERVTFCNTGSEAVMAALRICRTVTGRTKVVLFGGAYHGTFDEVLVRGATVRGEPRTLAIAPGIAPNLISEVVVLEYGADASLDWIRAHANELAAVLVEVVQSRHPDLQPLEFLQELRRITAAAETPLIFDEVITGFRCHPGGAQAYFGIRADLATYGKIVGGGMPLGFVAGRRELMDTFDGGTWQYGDDSFPSAGVTFFAGTFVRHPLAMAAAKTMLLHLKAEGPQLQAELGARTERMLGDLNAYFERHQVPVHLERFTSLWYPHFGPDVKWGSLLYAHLREKGVHIWEGRPCFLSTAHTAEDEQFIIRAFKRSVAEMQAGEFLAGTSDPEFVESIQRTPASTPVESETTTDQLFPMSEAQREMWLGAQMRPEAAGPHHACTGLWLEGPLDIQHLRHALELLIESHEGLRSTFNADGTEAIVHPPGQTDVLTIEDLSGMPTTERDARVEFVLREEGRRLLDLERGPLVSFRLLTIEPDRHLLIFTAQMMVCDGWSHYVVFEDLAVAYSALVTGTEPILKAPVRMREFAHWQQARSSTEEAHASESYWVAQYQNVPPVLNLPTSRPRPPSRTFEASRCSVTLDTELCHAIRRLAREQQNSYFALLLAAFQVWLYRLSGCRDLVVGVPFAAQGPLGMERFVGQCANTLPMRAFVDPAESFAAFLAATWSKVLDAQENWDFTFGQLASKLELPRDPSRIPLVSVLFNLDPPMSKVRFSGLQHRFFTGPRFYYQYDLGFNLVEEEGGIRVECDYNVNLFDADWIHAWTVGYEALLRGIVRDIQQPVGHLPMIPAEKTRELTLSDADPREPGHTDRVTLHELVAAQARRTPDAVAVESEGNQLTYAELDRQAAHAADQLQVQGINSNSRVGVCLERSVRLPVAMLGVLKAGAAYVPIDTGLPTAVIAEILREGRVELVVVGGSTEVSISPTVRRVEIEELLKGFTDLIPDQESATAIAVDEDDIAAVIYTPGNSGTRRGVEISHRAWVNLLQSMQSEPGLAPQDVMLGLSPISSSRWGLELWLPLTVGARVVIVPSTIALQPMILAKEIQDHRISVMLTTPSVWQLLLQSGWDGCGRLRAWSSGEALRSDLANRLLPLCGELWNLYGATETTVCCMTCRVQPGMRVSLGKPIDGISIGIMDEGFQPVPVGVPGELVISGIGLARGYLDQPEPSTCRFVAHPFDPEQKKRVYRSGDRARYDLDGRMEFLDRSEGLANIGGFLIELSEIEAALARHESVLQSVVVVREDIPGNKELVGYVVAASKGAGSENLRNFLRERLPGYMVPCQFVFLQQLPLTLDHKIDRKRLPKPDAPTSTSDEDRRDPNVAFVAPRTGTEKALAEIWEQVLDIEPIGIDDNFFYLGGQSMLAMRAVMLAGRMGLPLKPRSLFLHQTIGELARVLDQASTEPGMQVGGAANATGVVPLIPAQFRFLLERETCDPHHWNCSSLVQAPQMNANAIRQAVKALLAHHDALRLRLSNHQGEWSQCIEDVTVDIPFESHDVSTLEPRAQREHIQTICSELQAGLDLSNGPLLRVALFNCGPHQPDRLFFSLHHFVIDELSWEVFWEDFEDAYQQALNGVDIQLPRKTTSIREWSLRLREMTQSPPVQASIPQWLALPWDEVGQLPLDFPAIPGANTNASADYCELLLSAKESSQIVRPGGVGRPEEVMLAALGRTLADWSASRVALIDLLSHGRGIVDDADLSRTVGFMLCYQPVLVCFEAEQECLTPLPVLINQIRQLPPGYTFDLLRFFSEAKDIRRSFADLPHAEVLFNFTGPELDDQPDSGSPFRRCNDPCGHDHSPRNGRYYPLAISGAIVGDRLRFRFVYSRNLHKRRTIESLAARYRESFLEMARPQLEMRVALG